MQNNIIHDAPFLLNKAGETISSRASERDDQGKAERSMEACVNAFNSLYGTSLTETQGWMFMVLLKAARARQGNHNIDDYLDGAAYFALAGECADRDHVIRNTLQTTPSD